MEISKTNSEKLANQDSLIVPKTEIKKLNNTQEFSNLALEDKENEKQISSEIIKKDTNSEDKNSLSSEIKNSKDVQIIIESLSSKKLTNDGDEDSIQNTMLSNIPKDKTAGK